MDPVSAYINQFPEPVKTRLTNLRLLVRSTVPEAVESISYAMPAYKLNGKPLIYFAGYKGHVGVYATPDGQSQFKDELSSYKQGKGSVQFPNDQTFPMDLVKQMLEFNKSRIELNLKK